MAYFLELMIAPNDEESIAECVYIQFLLDMKEYSY